MRAKIDGLDLEVFKVQLSMFSSNGIRTALIYNENRSITVETDDADIVKDIIELTNNSPKCYIAGSVDDKGYIQFYKVVGEKYWF